jgi:hypothetical protein
VFFWIILNPLSKLAEESLVRLVTISEPVITVFPAGVEKSVKVHCVPSEP